MEGDGINPNQTRTAGKVKHGRDGRCAAQLEGHGTSLIWQENGKN